jgi:hypothetical protein
VEKKNGSVRVLFAIVLALLVFSACQPQTVIVEKEVKVTQVVEKEVEKEVTKIVEKEVEKVVTKVVEKEVEKVVTATPKPPAEFDTSDCFAPGGFTIDLEASAQHGKCLFERESEELKAPIEAGMPLEATAAASVMPYIPSEWMPSLVEDQIASLEEGDTVLAFCQAVGGWIGTYDYADPAMPVLAFVSSSLLTPDENKAKLSVCDEALVERRQVNPRWTPATFPKEMDIKAYDGRGDQKPWCADSENHGYGILEFPCDQRTGFDWELISITGGVIDSYELDFRGPCRYVATISWGKDSAYTGEFWYGAPEVGVPLGKFSMSRACD